MVHVSHLNPQVYIYTRKQKNEAAMGNGSLSYYLLRIYDVRRKVEKQENHRRKITIKHSDDKGDGMIER